MAKVVEADETYYGKPAASDLAEFDFRYNNRIRLGVNDGERAALPLASSASA
jgi:hypothetical protein